MKGGRAHTVRLREPLSRGLGHSARIYWLQCKSTWDRRQGMENARKDHVQWDSKFLCTTHVSKARRVCDDGLPNEGFHIWHFHVVLALLIMLEIP